MNFFFFLIIWFGVVIFFQTTTSIIGGRRHKTFTTIFLITIGPIIFIIISIGLFLISIKSYLNIKNTDINMFDVFIRDYDYKIGGKI